MFADLVSLIQTIGYVGIVVIIFAETGLFVGFFLPGDSLLFTAGFLASQGYLDIRTLVLLAFAAAVVGDSVGYTFGRKLGPILFKREDSRFFKKEHLERTKKYFDRYGGKTIVLARFIPIVRTFAPVLAGVGMMRYRSFLFYNVTGALFWAVGIPFLGYFLGSVVPGVDRYLLPIVLVIIATSVAPSLVHIFRDAEARSKLRIRLLGFLRKKPKST